MFLSDRPSTFHADTDLLGRKPALGTFLRVLHDIEAPSCVAVYGSWGVGKTSFLQSARACWLHGPSVWFDPWEHENRQDVLTPMLHALTQARPGSPPSEKAKRIGLGLLRILGKVGVKASKSWLGLDFEIEKLSGAEIAASFDQSARYHNEIEATKRDFASLVDEIAGPNERIVMFIDDLDRCLPETVVQLIEGTKLLLCSKPEQARIVFAFAIDRRVVGEAIRHRYGGASTYTGENYLEKIFDFSMEVPPVAAADVGRFVEKLADHELVKAALSAGHTNALLLEVLSSPSFANPRVIKRVINRIAHLLCDANGKPSAAGNKVAELDDAGRTQLLYWIAGTERYRPFRYFFLEASPRELLQLHRYLQSDELPDVPDSIAQLAGMPDFLDYYNRLGLNLVTDNRSLAKARKGIRDLDALLRAQGL